MKRQNISSKSVWEDKVGYSRAVRIGNLIEVSGTTASDGNEVYGKGDVYAQTVYILNKIKSAIETAGGTLNNVVRTRMYITNIEHWEEAGRAHSEFFDSIRPTTSMVEISRLIHPDLLIEIEATAVI
jgi:enamine deaminase RidA (YjgF/YER057c/UK114 family)